MSIWKNYVYKEMENCSNTLWVLQGQGDVITKGFDYVINVQEANPADFTNETDEGAPQSISLLLTYDLGGFHYRWLKI